MRKYITTLIIVIIITGAAVWGTQHLQFFQKLPLVFSQAVFAENGIQDEDMPREQGRGFRGGRGSVAEREGSGRGGHGSGGLGGRGQGRHAMTVSLAGWVNVLAYLSIFAFITMLTYYGEFGIRKLVKRQEACTVS